MQVSVSILFDNKVRKIYMRSTEKQSKLLFLILDNFHLGSLDNIYEISVTPNRIIIVREDAEFRDGKKIASIIKEACTVSNIDAYDWNGNHLWNIADIVGDIKMLFFGGNVVTREQFINAPFAKFNIDPSLVPTDHEFYSAGTDGRYYIIDMDTLEIVLIGPNK